MTAADHDNRIITFGCRLNAFESQAIKNALAQIDDKNLIVFNSCAVTSQAEKDLQYSIRKTRRDFPFAKIVVTGCAAQIDPSKYAQMSEVDLVIGNAEKTKAESYNFSSNTAVKINSNHDSSSSNQNPHHHLDQVFYNSKKNLLNDLKPQLQDKIKVNDIMSIKDTAPQLVSYFDNQTRAFLEIQNGCNHRCTFCIIPYGRGNSRSVPLGVIVEQCKKMVQAGHQEIVLTGVDISDYGKDLPAPITLAAMIKRLLHLVPDIQRLRLSSIDVAEIDNEFLEIMATEKKLMPYLHLSVQSGDDLILKRMKRRHNREQILSFCQKARQIRPDITFGADIIAGFPTEDDKMFENSLSLISAADLIFTHIFPYSPRQGTPAAKMPQLPIKIIKERAKILRDHGQQQLQKYLKQQINQTHKILIEKNNIGKTENFLDAEIINLQPEQTLNNHIFELKINNIEGNKLICSF